MSAIFLKRLEMLTETHEKLVQRSNEPLPESNGVFQRYKYPVLSSAHTPLFWRYDMNAETNPYLMERFGINAVFNAGAIKLHDKYLLIARVEGVNRKSFLAVAES